jgi:BolA protein
MSVAQQMRDRLQQAFSPEHLEIVDESESHRGHAGYRMGGESHFHVTIRAPAFAGMARVERHRALHLALGHDLLARIHALSLTISG